MTNPHARTLYVSDGRLFATTVSVVEPPSLDPISFPWESSTVRISSLVVPPPLEGVHVIENLNSASTVVYGFGALIVIMCTSETASSPAQSLVGLVPIGIDPVQLSVAV